MRGVAVIDNGHNWFEDDTCNGTAQGSPLLDPLSDNGGPTLTHALVLGSGAIDAGDGAVCAAAPVNALDQRGAPRPGFGSAACDIGAFELALTSEVVAVPAVSSALGLWSLFGALFGIGAWRLRRSNPPHLRK